MKPVLHSTKTSVSGSWLPCPYSGRAAALQYAASFGTVFGVTRLA